MSPRLPAFQSAALSGRFALGRCYGDGLCVSTMGNSDCEGRSGSEALYLVGGATPPEVIGLVSS